MTKIMTFIDGSWIYANIPTLAMAKGISDLHIDYGLLPNVLSRKVAEDMRLHSFDIVRTSFFASIPVNYDERDELTVQRRRDFYAMLKEEFHYETDLYPVNFRGRRIRRADRDPMDDFEPREKSVDIALASSLIYYGSVPNAYDIAVVVIGDRDYVPALQTVRRMGKRVAIASIRDSCAFEYADPRDNARVKDVDLIWLNDILDEVKLTFEARWIECQSEYHHGDRMVWTTYRPRRRQPFFCDTCRGRFITTAVPDVPREVEVEVETSTDEISTSLTLNATSAIDGTLNGPGTSPDHSSMQEAPQVGPFSQVLTGKVYEIKSDRFFGFLRADNGKEYYFNEYNLTGVRWFDLQIGMDVEFEVLRQPTLGKAGAATSVRRIDDDRF